MPVLRRLVAAIVLVPAILVAAGCGSSDDDEPTAAQRLAAPGATWSDLGANDQVTALRACRLDAAVAAATGGGVRSAPYYSGRYDAVAGVDGAQLHVALDAWFAQPDHAQQSIGEGCAKVLQSLVVPQVEPRADFAYPVATRPTDLYLAVTSDAARLPVRLTPSGARLMIGSAPDRATSTAQATVAGSAAGTATVTLRRLPLGVSYLRVRVEAGARSSERLLVVRRSAAPTVQAGTFAPITLRGKNSRGIPVLYLPRPAVATVATDDAALSLRSHGALLLTHAPGGREATTIPAGRYRDVKITTTGQWTIRLLPSAG